MPILYIECSTTGKAVPTGMVVPKSMPADHLIGNSKLCEICGKVHSWKGKDAFFLDEKGERNYLRLV